MSEQNRVYFDTEFIEDGRTIDLLSIGLVREDGATYYAEPAEADRSRADDWVTANVLPSLTGPVKPRAQIAAEIIDFVGADPEFWAYYADYDWVALCQLYGRMIDLPTGWPMFCRDLKQLAVGEDFETKQDDSVHNALGDALWVKGTMWAFDHRHDDCDEEMHSWSYFTPEQVDSYWMRCDLLGPHDEHENSHTGATWRTPATPTEGK